MSKDVAVIIGAGAGLSASLARLFAEDGMAVALAARNTDKLSDIARETGARLYACDAADAGDMAALFEAVDADLGPVNVAVYNPSMRAPGPIEEIDVERARQALLTTGYGGFLMAHEAAKRMVPRGSGTMLFTGASASVKGYKNSSVFAMGKHALRGLCSSLARELQPKGIHVAHFAIDGGIEARNEPRTPRGEDGFLKPDAIAETYMHVHKQHRSAWTWEMELRPWLEPF
jgi:NAD(P)-dependent dehydrogenase (short-subunit alcohol dehydrogenase family)